jgi:3-oxoacyl-[acyl-carrier protein] reductase
MSLRLSGKVAIVTGASKGIGAGIAKSLAAAGAAVAVNYSSSKEDAEKVVQQIISDGGRAFAVQGSVTSIADLERVFAETVTNYGQLDILVNNAGIYKFDPLEDVTAEEFNRQFGTNVLGTLLSTQQALKHFPERGGSVVNIGSVVSTGPSANSSIYSATKGAVDTLTKALAIELAPKNIKVNAVAPGLTVTEGTVSTGITGSDMERSVIAATPLGRAGQPEDIARVVTFLASEDANWLTGQILLASGGLR